MVKWYMNVGVVNNEEFSEVKWTMTQKDMLLNMPV